MADNAAAAPAQPSESTGSDNAAGGADNGGDVVDFSEILRHQRDEIQRTGQTVRQLQDDLGKSTGALDRVRKAFTNEDEPKPTPYQQRMKDFDNLAAFLDQEALENQRAGGAGLPITTKVGKQLVEYGKAAEARAEKLEAELAEIKQSLREKDNAALDGLKRAAFAMEGMVEEGLGALYGEGKETQGIRSAQFNAVTHRINAEIKDLMHNEPETLLKIQRNPKLMRRMVNHFMSEMLPPKVRTMLDDQRIQNEPMDSRELFQAFAEAREQLDEANSKGNQKAITHYSNLMTSIRQDILASQYGGRRSGNGGDRPTLNQLFRNSVGGG